MLAATHLQRFRLKYVALVQQEYHNSISSSRASVDFFEKKYKKVKIPRSENVSPAQQAHLKCRKLVTSVLRYAVFRGISSHFTCCILLCSTFSVTVFMYIFECLFILMHILKCNRLLCALIAVPLPSRSPFLSRSRPLARTFCNKKTAQAAFSGPSVLCRIPYIKRRAAPKSRPPTIQAML